MKIALLVPGGVDRGGTTRVIPCLLWLIERLVASGCDVHVFVPRQEDRPGSWPLLGATVHNAGRRPAMLWMLRAIAAEHLNARFDVIHAFWNDLGAIGALAGKVLDTPLVATFPGGDVVGIAEIGYGSLLTRLGRLYLRLTRGCAVEINTPSKFMQALAEAQGIEAKIVALGIDLDRWPPIPPRPRPDTRPIRLLHVASLNRVKDQPTLLRAAKLLKTAGIPFELTLIGCDTLHGEVQRMALQEDLETELTFLDERTHRQLRPWFERADLLVVSSRHEGGPQVTLEAAIAGVPTVGTRVGHIADLAPDAAVAVPVADPQSLANAIEGLFHDDARRLRLAAAAQDFALRHDADFTAASFLETYCRVRKGERRDEPRGPLNATNPR